MEKKQNLLQKVKKLKIHEVMVLDWNMNSLFSKIFESFSQNKVNKKR